MLSATILLVGWSIAAEPSAADRAPTDSAAVVLLMPVAQDPAPQKPSEPAEAKEPPTPVHTGIHALFYGLLEDVKHLPSVPNAQLAAIGGGVTLIAHPFDDNFNVKLRSHYNGVNQAFRPGKYLGQTTDQVAGALSTFAIGRATKQDKVSHMGMDLLRAQILAAGLTTGLKYATQRERPDGSNSHSFPSGHASITFATATVIERHLGWRMSALAYTVASYVAASRLHDNRHWLSDVTFGAAVGAIAGRTVTQHGRNYWTVGPVTVPGGVAFVVARTPPR
jgi:hypothetical protein